MENGLVYKTQSGFFVRNDGEYGCFVFSPFSGLVFGVDHQVSTDIFEYLNKQNPEISRITLKRNIEVGWDDLKTQHVTSNLNCSNHQWKDYSTNKPILINWLITGNCTHDCTYCFAEDLMRGKVCEPSKQIIIETVNTIISYSPLAVVLSGGEPLLSPHLKTIIELLYNKTGIIVDTNGLLLSYELIKFFKEKKVALRVSIDSHLPITNNLLRPVDKSVYKKNNVFTIILNNLRKALDNNLTVIVQTVLTSKNEKDLLDLGRFLYSLGVKSWRIQVIKPSLVKYDNYLKLKLQKNDSKLKSNQDYHYTISKLKAKYNKLWKDGMLLHINDNEALNSVILVAPNGYFYTESVDGKGKILIDKENPRKPSLIKVFNQVSSLSHFIRYINTNFELKDECYEK